MKLLAILAASLAVALAGCDRNQNAGAGGTSSSYKSPSSGASGSAAGSTSPSAAPKRPGSSTGSK